MKFKKFKTLRWLILLFIPTSPLALAFLFENAWVNKIYIWISCISIFRGSLLNILVRYRFIPYMFKFKFDVKILLFIPSHQATTVPLPAFHDLHSIARLKLLGNQIYIWISLYFKALCISNFILNMFVRYVHCFSSSKLDPGSRCRKDLLLWIPPQNCDWF